MGNSDAHCAEQDDCMILLRNGSVGHDAVTLMPIESHMGPHVGVAEPVDPVEPPVDEMHRDEPEADVWSAGHGWHMD